MLVETSKNELHLDYSLFFFLLHSRSFSIFVLNFLCVIYPCYFIRHFLINNRPRSSDRVIKHMPTRILCIGTCLS
jgi:hypothetical protein